MLELLPNLSYTADAVTRGDLCQGMLVDERAYIASWMARTRDLWRLAGLYSVAVVHQPSQSFEVAYGVDAIIALNLGNLWKFMAVEAKRPGFAHPLPWDQVKSVKGVKPPWSRFSRQIMRQSRLDQYGWLTGGLFIDERPHHSVDNDPLGCSFVPHSTLASVLPTKAVPAGTAGKGWTTTDIEGLIKLNGNSSLTNVREALDRLIDCDVGNPITTSQTRSMAKALFEKRKERTSLEGDFLPPAKLDQDHMMLREEILGGLTIMTVREDESVYRLSEEDQIIRRLVEVTGAAHGVVFSLPEAREGRHRFERWHEKNVRFRPSWET
jgi:hypothetical protein